MSSCRYEWRSFEAEEGGGSVTEKGVGIWRGTARPGISRGCEGIGALPISAMAIVAQRLFSRSLLKKKLCPFLHELSCKGCVRRTLAC